LTLRSLRLGEKQSAFFVFCVLVACIRKLLGILNIMLENNTPWNPKPQGAWTSQIRERKHSRFVVQFLSARGAPSAAAARSAWGVAGAFGLSARHGCRNSAIGFGVKGGSVPQVAGRMISTVPPFTME
jgi:hypothetical protein